MMTIIHRYALLLATACCVLGSSGALAQAYPNKPIKLLVGFPPGGGTDLLARLVAQQLAPKLGQPVVVDNRPGANTIIATDATAKAAADGYTLAMAATGNVANPSLYSKLPYDPYRDFTWITQLTEASLVLVASPNVQANSMKELITLAKARPGQISYASAGVGSSVHLAGVMLERMAGVQMLHVAYKGSGPALTDLLGGQVSMLFADIPQVMEHIKSGRLKALAVTTNRRSASLPDIPTIAEVGFPGYEVPVWYGVFGPAGMPRDVVDKLASNLKEVLELPAVKEKLTGWGVSPVGSTPAEFDSFIQAQASNWSKVIKGANIKIE
jgi:tripartite-type tricarboxylate transporter receptor subunit TctC